ncbi:MAG: TetR/AcrR family transcriptional regulator, partial [Pseudomonadota bacterium]
MATNKERRESTRANILAAARECFTVDGYENTHTSSILERAQISRGAMYHHFSGKRDVFEAVYVSMVEESIEHALGATRGSGSPLEDLISACIAWLNWVRNPAVAAILIEVPAARAAFRGDSRASLLACPRGLCHARRC